MTAFLWGYGLGLVTIVGPLTYLYIKGFFDQWTKHPVVTIEPAKE